MVADISVNKPNEEVEYRLTEMQREGHSNSKRIEAIKLLERVIGVCSTRLEDPVLLQEICIVIWNTSLPLLEPHLIQNVYRAFQLAASCLADIASPLVQLRAQLHFELAKCEEQNDFVVKAKAQTQLALQADYGKLLNPEPTGSVPGTMKYMICQSTWLFCYKLMFRWCSSGGTGCQRCPSSDSGSTLIFDSKWRRIGPTTQDGYSRETIGRGVGIAVKCV